MISIIGDGIIPEAKAFYDVRDALTFDTDLVLGAHISPILGITLKDVAIYNLEPLYDGCRSFSIGYLDILKRCHVIDYDKQNVEYLKTHGIDAFYMPYGYHDSLDRVKPTIKDIDVLFVGSANPRRNDILPQFEKEFNFVWAQGVYGQELDDLIARAKVHLNIHYCDSHPLEVVRLNYLMANHGNIVSEKGNDHEVNESYSQGLHFSDYDSLLETCHYALDNPIDGHNVIKAMPHSCSMAQAWLDAR